MAKFHYRDQASDKDKKIFAPFLAEDEELIVATGLGMLYLRSIFIIGLAWPGFIFLFCLLGLAYFLKLDLMMGFVIGVIFATLVAFFKMHIAYHSNRYLLTTRRVIIKKGVLAVKLTAALYDKITHIEVNQSLLDKLLMHHGTIVINTAGSNKDELVLKYIDYPIEFKNLLERLINRERERFGLTSSPLVTVEGEVVE